MRVETRFEVRFHPLLQLLFAAGGIAVAAAGCTSADVPPGTKGVGYQSGTCQHSCTPDPGPGPDNCALEESGLEFFGTGAGTNPTDAKANDPTHPALWNFEEDPNDSTWHTALARSMYSYTDKTNPISSFVATDSNGVLTRKTWEPPVVQATRCGRSDNHAVHIQGGPFTGWGGGVGMAMYQWLMSAPCPSVGGPDYCLTSAALMAEPDLADVAIDVSKWEGISFWARRGPDSESGIRAMIADKYTDDDIAFGDVISSPPIVPRCQRVRECACLNHMVCAPVGDPTRVPGVCPSNNQSATTLFCGTPMVDEAAGSVGNTNNGTLCNTCGTSRCDDPYPAFPNATDTQFYGKPCSPYTFRNGVSSYFCFDPAKETPAEPDQQCGDHWTLPVAIDTDWHLYTVPFTRLLQQGWAKRSNFLDLTAVTAVRFTWDGGYIDYWIDDVRFYRHAKT